MEQFHYIFAWHTASATSESLKGNASTLWLLLPLMHNNALLNRLKLSLVRIKLIVELILSSLFSAILVRSLLKNRIASLPIPPKHDKISGVNVLCSTFRILSLYFPFFDFSRVLYVVERDCFE